MRSLLAEPRYKDPKRLNRFERKVFSQFGEDGIIAEIFRRLGTTSKFFVEFGVESNVECCSALLLLSGWSGLWIEPDSTCFQAIQTGFQPLIESRRLRVLDSLVTAENIENLLGSVSTPTAPDLLVIDIDGNDYWVWNAITSYAPRVVVMEYNATFPPPVDWVIAYDPAAQWDGTIMFGASLTALERLGRKKGYSLVGCALGGSNAFFVRNDLMKEHFEAPFTAENYYEPPRYYLANLHAGHPRNTKVFAQGKIDSKR